MFLANRLFILQPSYPLCTQPFVCTCLTQVLFRPAEGRTRLVRGGLAYVVSIGILLAYALIVVLLAHTNPAESTGGGLGFVTAGTTVAIDLLVSVRRGKGGQDGRIRCEITVRFLEALTRSLYLLSWCSSNCSLLFSSIFHSPRSLRLSAQRPFCVGTRPVIPLHSSRPTRSVAGRARLSRHSVLVPRALHPLPTLGRCPHHHHFRPADTGPSLLSGTTCLQPYVYLLRTSAYVAARGVLCGERIGVHAL